MKYPTAKGISSTLIILITTFLFIHLPLRPGFAKPVKAKGPHFPFPGGKRGPEAISTLRERLPEVASRYGKSAEKLNKIFLQDQDLWLDPADNLLYLCSMDVPEADTYPEPEEAAIPTGPFPLNQTFQLHSLYGASRTIYLDFDGHVTSGTLWNSNFNSNNDIVSLPYDIDNNTGSFSDEELGRIQDIWARVAEDFAIYDIDVTTEDPGIDALRRSNSGDQYYGVRVVISISNSWYGSAGGVAYIGSFDWSSDTPAFVFSNMLAGGHEKVVAKASSHEIGHSLGLYHDGIDGGTSYYAGHGDWAPIMGGGYWMSITQWSKGEYTGADNHEDDLAVMLNNGAVYRPDDHGDWINNATMLTGESIDASGIIERTGDMDVFGFQIAAGNVSIDVDPAVTGPNLDILVQILDSGGNLIDEDDPYYILPASLDLYLEAGTYYILIDGVGTGDPDTGYTDYASLGQYFITGTLPVGDTDTDGDGIIDANDNCPLTANPNQADNDNDSMGDVCDPDDDNDAVTDTNDNCPMTANTNQTDYDGDSIGDVCDPDDDNDGMPDDYELTQGLDPFDTSDADNDPDGDGLSNLDEYFTGSDPFDYDTDDDGVADGFDGLPLDDQVCACPDLIKNGFTEEVFSSVQDALDDPDAADYDTIMVTAAELTQSVVYDRNTVLTISGGYYCDFSNNPAISSVSSLTIRDGTIIVENLAIF